MVLVLAEAALWFVAGDVDGGWAREEGLTQTSFAQQYMRSVEWAVSRWDTVGRLLPKSGNTRTHSESDRDATGCYWALGGRCMFMP